MESNTMTDNILLQYMQKRLAEEESKEKTHPSPRTGKPFITMSRQYGCPSQKIADAMEKRLNEITGPKRPWGVVNKEILENSAKELDLAPQQLRYVFEAQKKSVMDEVLSAMSTRYYKSDRMIRKTIRNIIEEIASQGYVVIIGRGGVAITNDFPNSLHIRLYAPQNWRLEGIMERHAFNSQKEAYNHLRYVDKKRIDLINHFSGGVFDFNKFDLDINCAKFSPEEVADIIVNAARIKKMI